MSLITELKRRNVFKVSAAYLALGWIVIQITATVTPAFNLPQSALPLVTWIGLIGFPFVVLFSWVYELTPEGLKRESEIDRAGSITPLTGKRLDYTIIALMLLAIALFGVRELLPGRAEPAAPAAVAQAQVATTKPLPAAALPAAALDPRSIAVLPFMNMSEDAGNAFFADGISEELLNLLAKIPELRVTSRSSAFAFKGEKTDIAAVAAKLHVANVLEGSVRKSGNRVRITVQLVDTRSDTHLWSETYDRTLDDIFAVQDEIAGAVVRQLRITLLGAVPTVQKADPRAYALVLQARQLMQQRTARGMEQAIALGQQALAIDPNYAAAWDGLAITYMQQGNNGERLVEEAHRLASEAVDKALAIDPDYAPAHATLGRLAMGYDNDLATAAQHYQKALTLDPADTKVLSSAALLAQNLGRVDTAIALLEYVLARDPVNPVSQEGLGYAYLAAGRYEESAASIVTALSLSPSRIVTHYFLGSALLLKGDANAALAQMQQEPDESWRLFGLAIVYHALDRKPESDSAVAELIRKYAENSAYNIGYVLAYRGEADRDFDWLDKAVDTKDGGLSEIVVQPYFANIEADPRWLPFLRKIGMAPEQLAAIRFDVKPPNT